MRRPRQSARIDFPALICAIIEKYGTLEHAACKMGRTSAYLYDAKNNYYHMAPVKILEEIRRLLGIDYRKYLIKNKKKPEPVKTPEKMKQMELNLAEPKNEYMEMSQEDQMICALNRVADSILELINVITFTAKEYMYEKIQ